LRIILNYLVPRILPVLIPQLVAMVPSFIFLEATLGLFNIKSDYPSWGRIIYEGLARGALYGSPFWVLEPISLLLLTGFAFAMLGSALERILNPRIIADIPMRSHKATTRQPTLAWAHFNKRVIVIAIVMVLFAAIFVPSIQGKTLARVIFNFIDQTIKYDPRITKPSGPIFTRTPALSIPPAATVMPPTPTEPFSTLAPSLSTPSTATITMTVIGPTLPPSQAASGSVTYTLHAGEYPYCIARRFNLNPNELLALNGLSNGQTFSHGMVLKIPQTAQPFPGERRLRDHPRNYTVSTSSESLYTIACQFGDIDPRTIAEANHIAVDSALFIGQKLNIP
jgi:LysM repeat protein